MAEDEFRSVGEGNRQGMSLTDKVAVISAMGRCDVHDINVCLCLSVMRQTGLISDQQEVTLRLRYATVDGAHFQRIHWFFGNISAMVSFAGFVETLRMCGYAKVADMLLLERYGNPLLCVSSRDVSKSEFLNKFYNSAKILLTSGYYPSKIAALENISAHFRLEVNRGLNQRARQKALDQLAVITCVKVNCIQNKDEILLTLSDLRHGMPDGLDTTCVDIVFYVSMCMTAKQSGDVESAKSYLDMAKMANNTCNSMFFRLLILHTQHILFRTIFSKNPTEESFHESIDACRLGISCCTTEVDVTRQQWRQALMIFAIMLHLRIGQDFEIPLNDTILETHRREAEEKLASVRSNLHKCSKRQEMSYHLIMAKICVSSDTNMATCHWERAVALSREGCYTDGEERNVRDFMVRLRSRLD